VFALAVPAVAQEAPPDSVPVGVVDGVEVAVGVAPVPPEPVATTVVDGVEVGVGEALVPPVAPEPPAAQPPAVTQPAPPAPQAPAERATPDARLQPVAQNATVELLLDAWS